MLLRPASTECLLEKGWVVDRCEIEKSVIVSRTDIRDRPEVPCAFVAQEPHVSFARRGFVQFAARKLLQKFVVPLQRSHHLCAEADGEILNSLANFIWTTSHGIRN